MNNNFCLIPSLSKMETVRKILKETNDFVIQEDDDYRIIVRGKYCHSLLSKFYEAFGEERVETDDDEIRIITSLGISTEYYEKC